jgi:hypothetical protein
MRRRPAFSALALMTVLSWGARATADPGEDPEALIRAGNQLRASGDNVRAEGYFKRAYAMGHTARAAAQLGLVELALENYQVAESYLSLALDADDAWVRLHRTELENSRVSARQQLVQVDIVAPPAGTAVSVNGGPVTPLPPNDRLWLTAGTNHLRFESPNHEPLALTVDGTAGATQRLALKMNQSGGASVPTQDAKTGLTSPETPMGQEPSSGSSQALAWTGIGIAGVGVIACVVGAVVGRAGSSKRDHIESEAAAGTSYTASDGNWQTLQTTGTVFLVTGAAAVIGGGALFFLEHRANGPAPERSRSARVLVSPTLDGFAVAGQF